MGRKRMSEEERSEALKAKYKRYNDRRREKHNEYKKRKYEENKEKLAEKRRRAKIENSWNMDFKSGRLVKAQARQISLRIYKIMKERFENEGKANASTLAVAETSEMTGVSNRTVQRIIAEGKRSTKLQSPSRKVSHHKWKTGLDGGQLATIKQIVYDFHQTEGSVTTERLTARVNKALEISLSATSMRRVIQSIGFKLKKGQHKKKLLCEPENIRLFRINYIKKVREFRSNGYDIVYIDETYIHGGHTKIVIWTDDNNEGLQSNIVKENRLFIAHAGSEKGFVTNALLIFQSGDYHDDMNFEKFSNWLDQKVLPHLRGHSVIVLDNASYHNKFEKNYVTSGSTKAEMQEWLKSNGIHFSESMLKAQLFDLIKKHRAPRKHLVDDLIRSYGHEVLRLPPYHPDLNPIEKIWPMVKSRVSSANTTFTLNDLLQLVREEFEKITVDNWKSACENAIKAENDYLRYETVFDQITDKLLISLSDDSSTSDYLSSCDNEESGPSTM